MSEREFRSALSKKISRSQDAPMNDLHIQLIYEWLLEENEEKVRKEEKS